MNRARARERAEVAVARVVRPSRSEDPRVLVPGRHHDVRVALVVPQGGVEARPVALYQVRFEDERLGLAPRDDEVYAPDLLFELRYLRAAVARAGEVVGDPGADVLRLADVDHAVLGVLEEVDARRSRKVRAIRITVLRHREKYTALLAYQGPPQA